MCNLDQDFVRNNLSYDPDTGYFTRIKVSSRHRRFLNKRAGTIAKASRDVKPGWYRQIRLRGVKYYEHVLAFIYMIGSSPEEIDHINRNGCDNRWINLRACTRGQNQLNKSLFSNNTSGYTGVHYHKTSGKWRARSGRVSLGLFDTPLKASEAYQIYLQKRGFV